MTTGYIINLVSGDLQRFEQILAQVCVCVCVYMYVCVYACAPVCVCVSTVGEANLHTGHVYGP